MQMRTRRSSMVSKSKSLALNQLFSGLDFQGSISLIPGSIYIKDKEGVFLYANDALKQDARTNLIGKKDSDMPWKEGTEAFRENDKKVMNSKKQIVFIEKAKIGGETKTVLSVKAPLYDDNHTVVGIIGHSVDIGDLNLL